MHARKTFTCFYLFKISLVHNWFSLYFKIQPILVISFECVVYYASWMDLLPYATL